MNNLEELPDDSDSSDEDYVPDGKNEDLPSEAESDGDAEEPLSGDEESSKSKSRRTKNTTKSKKNTKKNELQATDEDDQSKIKENEVDKKKKVDDLWADFMKDTGFRSRNSKADTTTSKESSKTNVPKPDTSNKDNSNNVLHKPKEKVTITEIFEFAGEEVKVEKEVDADSAQARLLNKQTEVPKSNKGKRSAGLSGIGSVLSQLGKKQKISTLEKTKLDWDKFKKDEQIEEELRTYNKGKDGYLDRQDFLQRADLRRFEIEKDIRNSERSKRFNSTL